MANGETTPDGLAHAQPRSRCRVQTTGAVRRPDGAPTDPTLVLDPWRDAVSDVLPRWADGPDRFGHLVILFSLNRASRRRLPGFARAAEDRLGAPRVGFVATRAPRRDGNRLVVTGIVAWDGDPILDINGDVSRDGGRPDTMGPPWLDDPWAGHDATRGEPPGAVG